MLLLQYTGVQFDTEAERLLRQVENPLIDRSFCIIQQRPIEQVATETAISHAIDSVTTVFESTVKTLQPEAGYVGETDGVESYSIAMHDLLFAATDDEQVRAILHDLYRFGYTALYSDALFWQYNSTYLILLWAHDRGLLDTVLRRVEQHRRYRDQVDDIDPADVIFATVLILITFSTSMEEAEYRPDTPWAWREPLVIQHIVVSLRTPDQGAYCGAYDNAIVDVDRIIEDDLSRQYDSFQTFHLRM